MSTPHHDKANMAEEILMRKFRAKCRFRAIVRMVMANIYWLSEGVAVYEGDNVKKRVEQAMRGTSKKQAKALLNLNDKALLNKDAEERTEHEKKYIYRIIGGLKCFKRYPNVSIICFLIYQNFFLAVFCNRFFYFLQQIVKKKLAAVTYFRYYGPGRVIVRQNHEAHALYFIVTGVVVVSLMVFDELLQKQVSVELGQMTVGDMFGEVSLLHNIPRTATCTTLGHCEFLMLMKDDFKNVLQVSVQKEWDQIRLAMTGFTYFDDLDPVSRRECCIVSKMKTFEPNETIIGDGAGVSNYIYFVLSGTCQMIETLQVFITQHLRRQYYKLYDPFVPHKESSQPDLDEKYFLAYKTEEKRDSKSINEERIVSSNTGKESVASERKDNVTREGKKSTGSKRQSGSCSEIKSQMSMKSSKAEMLSECSGKRSGITSLKSTKRSASSTAHGSKVILPPRDSDARYSVSSEDNRINPHTIFMQVCQFLPGSTFGFGENMRDRRIIAQTQVDCLLMPMVWLLQRNNSNIWTRVKHYLDKKIPTKKELFRQFVLQRRWQEYRDDVITDVISRTKTINHTSLHDVPYSIRMEEQINI